MEWGGLIFYLGGGVQASDSEATP